MSMLWLLRHSITTGNERKLYYGSTDLPLSEVGRALCLAQRDVLRLPDDCAFATTGMLRTEETLHLLVGNVPHTTFSELREMNLGAFELHTYDELKDNPDYQMWLNDTSDQFVIPGGESNEQFAHRICTCISQIANTLSENLLIVCHGGTIARAMLHLFPQEGKTFYEWCVQPCCGFCIKLDNGHPVGYTSIESRTNITPS